MPLGERRLMRRAGMDRHLDALPPRARVLAGQLPLSLLFAAALAAAPEAWNLHWASAWGQAALAVHAALLAASFLVPWQRFGPLAPLVLPVLDLAALGLSRVAAAEELPGLGVLSVLPAVWIAASRLSPPPSPPPVSWGRCWRACPGSLPPPPAGAPGESRPLCSWP